MKINSDRSTAIERALNVIEYMAAYQKDLPFSQILADLKIPRQSLVRILNTLCDRGIIGRTEQKGFYRLGMKLLYMGTRLKDKISLRAVAWPFMDELSRLTNKTIELSILDQDQLICIEQIQGNEGVNLYSRVGSVYPYLHAVSVGKIYLAHMNQTKRGQILERIGLPKVAKNTISDSQVLERDLETIVKQGYAFEDQELRTGVRRVAAPIYDYMDELAGCISIAAPIFSFKMNFKHRLGKMAVEAARKISKRMGQISEGE